MQKMQSDTRCKFLFYRTELQFHVQLMNHLLAVVGPRCIGLLVMVTSRPAVCSSIAEQMSPRETSAAAPRARRNLSLTPCPAGGVRLRSNGPSIGTRPTLLRTCAASALQSDARARRLRRAAICAASTVNTALFSRRSRVLHFWRVTELIALALFLLQFQISLLLQCDTRRERPPPPMTPRRAALPEPSTRVRQSTRELELMQKTLQGQRLQQLRKQIKGVELDLFLAGCAAPRHSVYHDYSFCSNRHISFRHLGYHLRCRRARPSPCH